MLNLRRAFPCSRRWRQWQLYLCVNTSTCLPFGTFRNRESRNIVAVLCRDICWWAVCHPLLVAAWGCQRGETCLVLRVRASTCLRGCSIRIGNFGIFLHFCVRARLRYCVDCVFCYLVYSAVAAFFGCLHTVECRWRSCGSGCHESRGE